MDKKNSQQPHKKFLKLKAKILILNSLLLQTTLLDKELEFMESTLKLEDLKMELPFTGTEKLLESQ